MGKVLEKAGRVGRAISGEFGWLVSGDMEVAVMDEPTNKHCIQAMNYSEGVLFH